MKKFSEALRQPTQNVLVSSAATATSYAIEKTQLQDSTVITRIAGMRQVWILRAWVLYSTYKCCATGEALPVRRCETVYVAGCMSDFGFDIGYASARLQMLVHVGAVSDNRQRKMLVRFPVVTHLSLCHGQEKRSS